MTIELHGIELHGHHGVLEHERQEGQRFLVDLDLEVAETTAAETDRIEDAVDYRDVVASVVEVWDARAYTLLEALASVRIRNASPSFARNSATWTSTVRLRVMTGYPHTSLISSARLHTCPG